MSFTNSFNTSTRRVFVNRRQTFRSSYNTQKVLNVSVVYLRSVSLITGYVNGLLDEKTECLQMNGAVSKVNKKFLTLHGQNVNR